MLGSGLWWMGLGGGGWSEHYCVDFDHVDTQIDQSWIGYCGIGDCRGGRGRLRFGAGRFERGVRLGTL